MHSTIEEEKFTRTLKKDHKFMSNYNVTQSFFSLILRAKKELYVYKCSESNAGKRPSVFRLSLKMFVFQQWYAFSILDLKPC